MIAHQFVECNINVQVFEVASNRPRVPLLVSMLGSPESPVELVDAHHRGWLMISVLTLITAIIGLAQPSLRRPTVTAQAVGRCQSLRRAERSAVAEALAREDLGHALLDQRGSSGRLLCAGDVQVVLAPAARRERLERSAQIRIGVQAYLEFLHQFELGAGPTSRPASSMATASATYTPTVSASRETSSTDVMQSRRADREFGPWD